MPDDSLMRAIAALHDAVGVYARQVAPSGATIPQMLGMVHLALSAYEERRLQLQRELVRLEELRAGLTVVLERIRALDPRVG